MRGQILPVFLIKEVVDNLRLAVWDEIGDTFVELKLTGDPTPVASEPSWNCWSRFSPPWLVVER